ncbi:antitoxin [Actinomycetospora lemnae]|uniref:Antitoxin n=1 Tax=Actinomycetospora lemnae TaxID=3019891 RepID=A0ABT5SX13_9PSEU|nr:antitoxin [Actinomycetospora sp. DW7H6]MDD7966243.1 antitoxin [Actinomycetospora sp. DW7H6]
MSRDDYVQQGKQFANDLRETASKKVADNEQSILGAVGKAARWVDQKTGGKYSEQIGRAEAKVGEGVGWAAKQGTGEPQAPGAAAGDGTEHGASGTPGTPGTPGTAGPTGTAGTPGSRPSGNQPPGTQTPSAPDAGAGDPTPPHAEGAPAGPGASTAGPGGVGDPPTGPVGPPTSGRSGPPPSDTPTDPGRPTHPPRDPDGGAADWPRPPQS